MREKWPDCTTRRSEPGQKGSPGGAAARAWRAEHGHAVLARLVELLALPNVSSDRAGIRRNAAAIEAGFAALEKALRRVAEERDLRC